jgi:tetrapyrrole methylase family protein/MazG family protein
VVGLGPGDVRHLTLEAAEVLDSVDTVYVRTARHPTIDKLRERFPRLEVNSFDDVYESETSFEEVYGQIVRRLLDRAKDEEVVYAVPGSPSIDETTVRLLLSLAATTENPIRLVQGLSYIEPVLGRCQEFDSTWLSLIDAVEIDLLAHENAVGEVPGKPGRLSWRSPTPTAPLLISQLHSAHIAASVKLWLSRYWPETHEVALIRAAGTDMESVESLPIYRLDRIEVDHLTSLFVPPVAPTEDVRTFAGLMNVTQTLRAPGGCPWDREQTHDSLKTHLLEEAYEVVETLDEKDYPKLTEELGDLLFQVTIHSQIAAEHDEFTIEDVIAGITSKLIQRHPHVFGEMDLPTAASVLERWETFKQSEKPERVSVLSSIPVSMPALPYSYAVQKRAANQGFEWPDMEGLLGKVSEELDELRAEIASDESRARIAEELGDLLFVLVSVGRRLKVDPEEALRRANRKFVERFRYVEAAVKGAARRLPDLSAGELDGLWEEAKRQKTPA